MIQIYPVLQATETSFSALLCCGFLGFIIVIGIVVAYIYFMGKIGGSKKQQQEEQYGGERKIEVEEEEIRSSSTDFAKKKKSEGFLDKLFDRKKTCEECGAELEYREAYDSWYCPNCHTFK